MTRGTNLAPRGDRLAGETTNGGGSREGGARLSTQQSNEGKHTRQKPRVNNNPVYTRFEIHLYIYIYTYIYIHAANRKETLFLNENSAKKLVKISLVWK